MTPHFKGFETRDLPLTDGLLHLRVSEGGDDARPVLLLHGFPQTGAMWRRVAEGLAASGRRVIVPDLPGYGESRLAATTPARMSKRRLGQDLLTAMYALGYDSFDLAGHDRGGRVAYRMAFDRPQAIRRLAVLDIAPTLVYWERCGDRAFAVAINHWMFLGQSNDIPETLIGADPDGYLQNLLASWTAAHDLSAFEPEALSAYTAQGRDPVQLKALIDDYRAGATLDADHDAHNRAQGERISMPLLVLWGGAGITSQAVAPLETWRDWADDVSGHAVESGHFLPEEAPASVQRSLDAFFRE